MTATKTDPTERMIAVLERIETEARETNQRLGRVEVRLEGVETELRGVKKEAKETNQRLGRVEVRLEGLETQAKRTNKRLAAQEKRLTSVEVPGMAVLEAAVFKTAAE